MKRLAISWWLCALTISVAAGCGHFLESRAIDAFTAALDAQDLAALKDHSSDAFEQKALRRAEALDDMQILHLPTGETSITEVEDVSETEKRVTVKAGESTRKVFYQLIKDGSGEWVVNDVYLQQKHQGLTAKRSVTEQMDLLLTVREFLAAWDGGEREAVLAVTTPKLRALLESLPPAFLERLTRQVIGERPPSSKLKPKAELDANVAVVRLPRGAGEMVLSMKLLDDAWKVDDLAVESRSEQEHVPSLVKTATAMKTAAAFLTAFANEDVGALERVATEKFFRSSLAPADLSSVRLPSAEIDPDDYTVKLIGERADFVIRGETETVQLTMVRTDAGSDADAPVAFAVEDVTIYELDGREEKRLSALFTSQGVMRLFADALARGDLAMLRTVSTADLNDRVWQHAEQGGMALLPVEDVPAGPPRILATHFDGPITEIAVRQGPLAMSYLLRDRDGEVQVDDVLLPFPNRPESLKKSAEILLPVRRFTAALAATEIAALQRNASKDFNRLVWKQTEIVPDIGFDLLAHLRAPLRGITELSANEFLVTLGDERLGAQVLLVREYAHLVVDDVHLIAGTDPSQRVAMKNAMRLRMAQGDYAAAPGTAMTIDRPAAAVTVQKPVPLPATLTPLPLEAVVPPQPMATDDVASTELGPTVEPLEQVFGAAPEPARFQRMTQ